jgi:hypothetical protein
MKLQPITIDNLALMICGDEEYQGIFPYRSSSKLTDFFRRINLRYIHAGETRRYWVRNVLDELNTGENADSRFPSIEIIKVIEHLLDPREFYPNTRRDEAIEPMRKLIEGEGFSLDFSEPSKPKLMLISGDFISTAVEIRKTERLITFAPEVFKVPEGTVIDNQVSVMMPFSKDFDVVYETIKGACKSMGLQCHRVDEVWKDSAIIQDVFDLIFTSSIVIADLSGKNPNVFYEVGIAHTLGKFVIPIVQNTSDISFDVGHHRVLKYSIDEKGKTELKTRLESRLKTINAKIQKNSQHRQNLTNLVK